MSETADDRAVVLKQHEEYVAARQARSDIEHEFALARNRKILALQAFRDLEREIVSLERRLSQAEKHEQECWISLGSLPREE